MRSREISVRKTPTGKISLRLPQSTAVILATNLGNFVNISRMMDGQYNSRPMFMLSIVYSVLDDFYHRCNKLHSFPSRYPYNQMVSITVSRQVAGAIVYMLSVLENEGTSIPMIELKAALLHEL